MLSARVTPPQTALAPMAQMASMPQLPTLLGDSVPGEAAAATGFIVVGAITVVMLVITAVLIVKFGKGTKEVAERYIDKKYR